jgi:cyclopropane fatty-acyl-phospholipid synthase-like methyltransferase
MRMLLLAGLWLTACRSTTATNYGVDDADAWASKYEDPNRAEWQKPDEVIAALHFQPDMHVADIGSATGYFAVRVAKAVPQGHVYGADVESTMVDYLNRRIAREGITNVTSHVADFDDAKLPVPVDVILLVNTYHHIEQRPVYFKKLMASLKKSGRLAIIDFTVESKLGPVAEAKISPAQVEAELKEAGFAKIESFDFLPEQFFSVFVPRDSP